jgi:hypothetical protein
MISNILVVILFTFLTCLVWYIHIIETAEVPMMCHNSYVPNPVIDGLYIIDTNTGHIYFYTTCKEIK